MATVLKNLSLDELQWIADHMKDGMVVSCYADLSVSSGVRPLWREHLRNQVRQAMQPLEHDPPAREALQRCVEAIDQALSSPAAKPARGMAVFATPQPNLVRAITLPVPMASSLHVQDQPYLVPVIELLQRQRDYLVVHTDTHRGRLYGTSAGTLRLIAAVEENVPRKQKASGQRWGKQQATIARHREDHILHYRKELVEQIAAASARARYSGIVLLGEHEVLEHLRKDLPAHLAQQVVYEGPHAWAGRQPSLEAKVQRVADEAVRAEERRLAEVLRERLDEKHRVATGPQAVIDALQHGHAAPPASIVMGPDTGQAGWRCMNCGSIFEQVQTVCPFCQGRCDRSNLWQEIALLALRRGVGVRFVGADFGLGPHGGVVAMVARGEPAMPSA